MQYLPNSEANRRLPSIVEQLPRILKELPWVFAATGEKLDDVQLRTVEIVPGATLQNTVELDHSRAKAKAEDEAVEATAKAKVKAREVVKVKAKEMEKTAVKVEAKREEARRVANDRGPERQVEQHPLRGLARPLAGDRHPKTRRRCAFYTPKGRARRVTRIVR